MSELNEKVTFRLATLNDADQLARLRWEFSPDEYKVGRSFEDFHKDFCKFFEAAIPTGNWHFWVAQFRSEIIATVFVESVRKVPRPSREERYFAYITNVYTKPEHRGKGIGKRLMEHVLEAAKKRLDNIILWPADASVEFYTRLGFTKSIKTLEMRFD